MFLSHCTIIIPFQPPQLSHVCSPTHQNELVHYTFEVDVLSLDGREEDTQRHK